MLNPAVRVLWRGPATVQLELGNRAVLVDGVDSACLRRLTTAGRAGRPPESGEELVGTDALAVSGYLWPGCPDEDDLRLAAPRPRLGAELGALSTRFGERAAEMLQARRHYAVAVHGSGRVAGHLAALLAAAGIGRVHVTDDGDTQLQYAVPGGVRPGDEGRHYAAAVTDAVLAAAPEADPTPLPSNERPDLVVLAVDEPIDPERSAALHARDWSHLVVRLGSDHGVVGPLVIPGLTSCLRCADLHRVDRDPAWHALAVQLSVASRRGGASDVALATVIAGVAALQALAYLDGGQPNTIEKTIELHLPDWRLRRRSWPPHPGCDCGAEPRPR